MVLVLLKIVCYLVFFWHYVFFFFVFFFFFLMIRRPPRSTLFPLHDALPILSRAYAGSRMWLVGWRFFVRTRSEEHTSELQSRPHLVCRLLLEKKKKQKK